MSEENEGFARVWEHTVGEIEQSPDITPRQLAFVKLARPLGLLNDTIILSVGNELTKDYLESRVRTEVIEALSHALGHDARFAITVDPSLDVAPDPLRPAVAAPVHADPATGNRYLRLRAQPGPLKLSYQASVELQHQRADPANAPATAKNPLSNPCV